jgi:hypothetical protein
MMLGVFGAEMIPFMQRCGYRRQLALSPVL